MSASPPPISGEEKPRNQVRRLSLTSMAGKDILGLEGLGNDNGKSKVKPKATTVRRRSIVEGSILVERHVSKKLTEVPNSNIAKAIQTPLAAAVQILGSIIHMDNLPVEVHDKVDSVLTILGEPESLLVVKMPQTNKVGMDQASKEWYNEFLAGAPEIDDMSETARSGDQDEGEGDINRIRSRFSSLGGEGEVDSDGEEVRMSEGSSRPSDVSSLRSLQYNGKHSLTTRKRAMKAAMSDITPSDIVNNSESEDEEGGIYSSEEERDDFIDEVDDSGRQSVSSIASNASKGPTDRWSLIKNTMTPLMRWIAQGKNKRPLPKKEKSGRSSREKSSGVRSDSSRSGVKSTKSAIHRKSLQDLAGHRSHIESAKSSTKSKGVSSSFKKTKSPKSPQMFEIALPDMVEMKDDTIEPLQKFFEEQQFDAWHFNVFSLETLTKNHSLWFIAMILFEHYKIVDIFQIDQTKLSNFLLQLEESYCFTPKTPNPYHNHIHAADVLQTVAHFSTSGPVQKKLRVIHGFALFVAAMGHDYKHPGRTNAFLIHSHDEIAITYNDRSVLENFHAASLFKLMMQDQTNILSGMDNKELRTFRNMCVKTILATDLASGFEYVGLFKSHVTTGHAFDSEESKLLLMAMIMKVADVSHPCKQWPVHERWSELISEEFFIQGDLEDSMGMPISPLCDRTKHYLPKSQCDFVDYVVRPCVEVFSEYCKSDLWTNTMNENYGRWKSMIASKDNAKGKQIVPIG